MHVHHHSLTSEPRQRSKLDAEPISFGTLGCGLAIQMLHHPGSLLSFTGNMNFARRTECNRCGAPRPEDEMGGKGKGKGDYGKGYGKGKGYDSYGGGKGDWGKGDGYGKGDGGYGKGDWYGDGKGKGKGKGKGYDDEGMLLIQSPPCLRHQLFQ